MYLQPKVVDEILFFVVKNSGKNSSILFDYLPHSVADESSKLETGMNLRNQMSQLGESFKFGIKEETIETFLMERVFSRVQSVTAEEYRKCTSME